MGKGRGAWLKGRGRERGRDGRKGRREGVYERLPFVCYFGQETNSGSRYQWLLQGTTNLATITDENESISREFGDLVYLIVL